MPLQICHAGHTCSLMSIVFQKSILSALDSGVPNGLPSWSLRTEEKPRNDDDRKKDLKEHNDSPVPFSEALGVFGACVVDPICDKRSHSEVELPEAHDSAPKIGRCYFVDENWSSWHHQSLAKTGDDATGDKTTDDRRCKRRNKGRDDDKYGAYPHTPFAAESVGDQSRQENAWKTNNMSIKLMT